MMTNINVHDAKTHLSRYLALAEAGETVIICRDGKPVARMTALDKNPTPGKKKKALLGCAKGKIGQLPPSFFEPLTEEELPGFNL